MLSHYSTPPRVVLRYLVRIEEGTVMQSPSGQVSKDRAPVSISNPVPAPSQWSRPTLLHASTSKITVWEGSGVHVLHSAYRNRRVRVAWSVDRFAYFFLYIYFQICFSVFFYQKRTIGVLKEKAARHWLITCITRSWRQLPFFVNHGFFIQIWHIIKFILKNSF